IDHIMTHSFSHTLSINPYTGKTIRRYPINSDEEIQNKIENADQVFEMWRKTDISQRQNLFMRVTEHLEKYESQYSRVITTEMGKPISQEKAEIKKCGWIC